MTRAFFISPSGDLVPVPTITKAASGTELTS